MQREKGKKGRNVLGVVGEQTRYAKCEIRSEEAKKRSEGRREGRLGRRAAVRPVESSIEEARVVR